ncbi:unnamed protein product [Allacma fusca]|uniref:Uncharacterized protein n=1 Tax=Allacma fusca TaxID=39272 RepID=A0A8J2LCV2_9HEXA|nr:unnamed protein product [Allacma fusca]
MPPKKSLMDMVTSLFELQFVGPPKKIYVGRGGYFYLDYSIEEWKQLTLLYVLRLIPPFVSHIVVLCQDDGKVMALANLGSEISRQVYAVQNKSDEYDRTADTNRFCACGGVLITPDACWEIDSSNISIVVVYDVPTSKMKNGQQLGLRKILGQNKVVIYFMKCINYPKLADFILKDIPWINLSKLPVNFEFE